MHEGDEGGTAGVYGHVRAESRGNGRGRQRVHGYMCAKTHDAWEWRGASGDAQLEACLVA
jgi:hypothetical protein